MHKTRLVLICSWLIATLIIGASLFSVPYMSSILQGNAIEGRFESILAFIFGALIFGLPWLFALKIPDDAPGKRRKYIFSIGAVIIASCFAKPIASGQDFMIGLMIIFYIICIWIFYPLTSIGNQSK